MIFYPSCCFFIPQFFLQLLVIHNYLFNFPQISHLSLILYFYIFSHITLFFYKITITNNSSTITYKVAVKGDVNGDGKISISDYAKVKSHILGVALVDNEYKKAADVNGDGNISIADYAKIKSHILGTSKITK